MSYRPAGYSSEEDDEFEGFSFGGETKTVKEKQAEQDVQAYKKRLNLNDTSANRMYSAVSIGNLEAVKKELDNGININCNLTNNYTPLFLAASLANPIIVSELIKRGADINSNRDGFTALMAVCDCTNTSPENVLEIVNMFIVQGANIQAIDRKRRTCLMLACAQGFPKVVDILLPLSDLELLDNQGWSALFYAAHSNKPDIIQMLLKAGANASSPDVRGYDVKYYASINDYQDVLKLLPKEEIEMDPQELVGIDSSIESLFQNVQNNGRPSFGKDVQLMLYGMQCEQLGKLFKKNDISLENFLVLDDSELQDCGVKMSFQRNRILSGLHNFHKYPWKQKSLPSVAGEESYSTYDILIAVANTVKHLIVMESSLKYVTQNLVSDKTKEDRKLLGIRVINMLHKFQSIKYIGKVLHENALQLNAEIPNQPDLITSKSKFKKSNWLQWVTLLSVTCVPIIFVHRYYQRSILIS